MFSGQGESSGQYIPIHNCTPFTLQLDGKPEVQNGKELTTPAAGRETQYMHPKFCMAVQDLPLDRRFGTGTVLRIFLERLHGTLRFSVKVHFS